MTFNQSSWDRQQRAAAHRGAGAKAVGGRGSGTTATAAENAPRNQQSSPAMQGQAKSSNRPQPSPLAFDALLLNSFHSTVAAAGDTDSSWLFSGSRAAAGEEEELEGCSVAQLPSPSRQQPPSSATTMLPQGGPSSPTALLLPHLHSAGAEGTSWLVSSSPPSSPPSSPELVSSPSLATSRSISFSRPMPGPAAAQAAAAASPDSSSQEEAKSASPIILLPLPLGFSPVSAAAVLTPVLGASAGSRGWWPGSGPAPGNSSTPSAPQADAYEEDLSPLAARLSVALSLCKGSTGSIPQEQKQEQHQWGSEVVPAGVQPRRRHSSPFLSRDCSRVDVFCPDRYSSWTWQREEVEDRDYGLWQRQQHAGPRDEVEAGAGSRASSSRHSLRRMLGAALQWVSDRLVSHPIELTPLELVGYGSCSSSMAGTPCSSPSPTASRFFTPASSASADGSSAGRLRCGTTPLHVLLPSSLAVGLEADASWAPQSAAAPAPPGALPCNLQYSPEGEGCADSSSSGSSCDAGGSCSGTPTAVRWGMGATSPGSSNRARAAVSAASPAPPAIPGSAAECSRPVALLAHLAHEQQDWHLQPGSSSCGSAEEGCEQYHSAACCSSHAASGYVASASASIEADSSEAPWQREH